MLSIVIPTYREALTVPRLVPLLEQLRGVGEVVIVDDYSGQESDALAEWAGAQDLGRVRLFQRFGQRGLGSAVRAGARIARYDSVLVMDGDGQHRPEDAQRVIDRYLESSYTRGYRCVIGSRFVRGSRTPGLPPHRRLASLALNRAYSRHGVRDVMSGFFATHQWVVAATRVTGFKVLKDIVFHSPYRVRYEEVPIVFGPRLDGHSKAGVGEIINLVRS